MADACQGGQGNDVDKCLGNSEIPCGYGGAATRTARSRHQAAPRLQRLDRGAARPGVRRIDRDDLPARERQDREPARSHDQQPRRRLRDDPATSWPAPGYPLRRWTNSPRPSLTRYKPNLSIWWILSWSFTQLRKPSPSANVGPAPKKATPRPRANLQRKRRLDRRQHPLPSFGILHVRDITRRHRCMQHLLQNGRRMRFRAPPDGLEHQARERQKPRPTRRSDGASEGSPRREGRAEVYPPTWTYTTPTPTDKNPIARAVASVRSYSRPAT